MNNFKTSYVLRAQTHGDQLAVIENDARVNYNNLVFKAHQMAAALLREEAELRGKRVAFLLLPGSDYICLQWAVWLAGGVAVPLSVTNPYPEHNRVIEDSDAGIVVVDPEFGAELRERGSNRARILNVDDLQRLDPINAIQLENRDASEDAMILYTSGTTGIPKGVVLTHDNIRQQIEILVSSWGWTPNDRILHALPLHHIHGIVNALCCPLWIGASCQFLRRFDPKLVWEHLKTGQITVLMAVPTMFVRLIKYWKKQQSKEREVLSQVSSNLRLMVSGSAALPEPVFEEWKSISSHSLLERYGMTEIGMALSNPLCGERRAGTVGQPLPGVQVRLVDDKGEVIAREGQEGEIEVCGPTVFSRYWENVEETKAAFRDGWFCTGDSAIVEEGYWRILGRNSVDIIKTGGFKISALEVEGALLTHPDIREFCVVGTSDEEWGERVCAVFTESSGRFESLRELRRWAKKRIAPYKIPTRLVIVGSLSRNSMGKINKVDIVRDIMKGNLISDEIHTHSNESPEYKIVGLLLKNKSGHIY